jgi:hypothetical protein
VLLQFQGQGSTVSSRTASMQAQLAAFGSATPSFLHPTCWPDHPCLTSIDVDVNTAESGGFPEGSKLCSGSLVPSLRVPSLRSLHIDLTHLPMPSLPGQQPHHASSLLHLTCLEVITTNKITAQTQPLWESIGALTNLETIYIAPRQDCNGQDIGIFTIPATWGALSRLTKLTFQDTCFINPAALTSLTSIQSLVVHPPAKQLGQVVACCAQLASLTSLIVLDNEGQQLPGGDNSAAQFAASLAPLQAPCRTICSPIQDLWIESSTPLADVPFHHLACLTQLYYCGIGRAASAAFPGIQLCLASLQLLQELELRNVTATEELVWCVLARELHD